MCDYSLRDVAFRPAKVGDKLVSTTFHNSITRGFAAAGKWVFAICHGIQILVAAGLVKGRNVTCYENVRNEVEIAGGTWCTPQAVRDGRILTADIKNCRVLRLSPAGRIVSQIGSAASLNARRRPTTANVSCAPSASEIQPVLSAVSIACRLEICAASKACGQSSRPMPVENSLGGINQSLASFSSQAGMTEHTCGKV